MSHGHVAIAFGHSQNIECRALAIKKNRHVGRKIFSRPWRASPRYDLGSDCKRHTFGTPLASIISLAIVLGKIFSARRLVSALRQSPQRPRNSDTGLQIFCRGRARHLGSGFVLSAAPALCHVQCRLPYHCRISNPSLLYHRLIPMGFVPRSADSVKVSAPASRFGLK